MHLSSLRARLTLTAVVVLLAGLPAGTATAADSATAAGPTAAARPGGGGGGGGGGGTVVGTGSLSTRLPGGVVGGYWQMWNGPRVSEVTANAPRYTLHYAAFAVGSDRNGRVAFNPVFSTGAELKADIAASQAAGHRWLISVGGGADRTIRLATTTHADNMFASLQQIISAYGFDGVDIDIECGSTCWSPNAAVYLANRLKSFYGNDFIVTAAPRPFEVRSPDGIYAKFALQARGSVDLVTMQDFDFAESGDASRLASIVDADIDAMVAMGIPDSKIVIGCITYSAYSGGHNTVEVYRDIYLAQKAKHPGLRGVYLWELSFDKADGWGFTPVMAPAVLGA